MKNLAFNLFKHRVEVKIKDKDADKKIEYLYKMMEQVLEEDGRSTKETSMYSMNKSICLYVYEEELKVYYGSNGTYSIKRGLSNG